MRHFAVNFIHMCFTLWNLRRFFPP